jgi:hypothetical protein
MVFREKEREREEENATQGTYKKKLAWNLFLNVW